MINCNENKPYIFISYAHRDSEYVLPIIDQAEKDGYNIWYDEGIDPGTEWDENIAKHIENSSYFIAFISENYIDSKNCKDELNYSRDLDKKQFLVYLEDVTLPSGMAMRMNRIQAIFWNKYTKNNINEAFNKLYSAEGINIAKVNQISTNEGTVTNIPLSTVEENTIKPTNTSDLSNDTQFCSNCGKQINTNSDFCIYCGHPTKIVNIPSETLNNTVANNTTINNATENKDNNTHKKKINKISVVIIFVIVIMLAIYGFISFRYKNNSEITNSRNEDTKIEDTKYTDDTKDNEGTNIPLDNIIITDVNPEDIAIAYLYDLSTQNYEGAIALYPDFITCDENEKKSLGELLVQKHKNKIEYPEYPLSDYIYEYGALLTVQLPHDEFIEYKKYICNLFKDTIDENKLTNAISVFYSREIYDKNKTKVSFDNYLLYEFVIEYDGKWYIIDDDL